MDKDPNNEYDARRFARDKAEKVKNFAQEGAEKVQSFMDETSKSEPEEDPRTPLRRLRSFAWIYQEEFVLAGIMVVGVGVGVVLNRRFIRAELKPFGETMDMILCGPPLD